MSMEFRLRKRGRKTKGPERGAPEKPGPVSEMPAVEVPGLEKVEVSAPESRTGKVPAGGPPEETPAEQVWPCPQCGAEVEEGAKFCTQCAAPIVAPDVAAGAKGPEAEPWVDKTQPPPAAGKPLKVGHGPGTGGIEPWAVKAGESAKRLPKSVKYGIPILLLLIAGIVITLFVLAGTHSPEAAINRYLGDLKVGDYQAAYELVVHPGGDFSSEKYFVQWQTLQGKELGKLEDFTVQPRKEENRFMGRLLSPPTEDGSPFVVMLKYEKKTYDVNMVAENAGGVWPLTRWRIKLTGGTSRLLVTPIGAKVFVDGQLIGPAEPDKDLRDALQLKDFPDDIDSAVDYGKKLKSTFDFLVNEFRRLATNLEAVLENAQRVVNRLGGEGVAWTDILDASDAVVQQGRELGQDIIRTAIHLYWIFGGGDDGSVRARLTRVQSGLDVTNLPEGWHQVRAVLPGATTQAKEWTAPQDVELNLEATTTTRESLETAMNAYFNAVAAAESTLNPAGLAQVSGGQVLKSELQRLNSLAAQGQVVVSRLRSVAYRNDDLLTEAIATIETTETWDSVTYQGGAPVASSAGREVRAVYTLRQGKRGDWKVIERKEL